MPTLLTRRRVLMSTPAIIGAMALLGGPGTGRPYEAEGLAIDFTTSNGVGQVAVRDNTTVANNRNNIPVNSFLANAGTSVKWVRNAAGIYVEWPAQSVAFEYDSGWYALIEPAATNICLQSSNIGTTWGNTNSGEDLNAAVAPDGATTADRLKDDGGGGTGAVTITQTVTTAASTAYTFSVFLKADGLSWARIAIGAGIAINAYFQLSGAGAVGATLGANNSSQGIKSVGNGWYRCWVTGTTAPADTSYDLIIRPADDDGDETVDRDGTSSIFVWGAQLELGTVPTSPIPTTTATVTRATEAGLITALTSTFPLGAAWTSYTDFQRVGFAAGVGEAIKSYDDGSNAERVYLDISTAGAIRAGTVDGNVSQALINSGVTLNNNRFQATHAAAANSFAVSVNGSAAGTDTAGTMPTVTTLRFGIAALSAPILTPMKLRRFIHVPRRVSDADLPTFRYQA